VAEDPGLVALVELLAPAIEAFASETERWRKVIKAAGIPAPA
jgi:hypothetical protein